MQADETASIIQAGDPGQIDRLLRSLPATLMDAAAHPLARSESLYTRLLAFDILSTQIVSSGQAAPALWLSTAALGVAISARDDAAFPPGAAAKLVASLAVNRANALMLAGRQAEVAAQEQYVGPCLDPEGDRTGCDMLAVKTVEALLELNALEEADRRLSSLEQAGSQVPSLPAVRARLQMRLVDGGKLPDPDAINRIKDQALGAVLERLLKMPQTQKP